MALARKLADDRAASGALNVFCSPEGESFRVYVRPNAVPRYLYQCLDEHHEVFPAELDFEDLARFMAKRDAKYSERRSSTGGVEITAEGASASALAEWLSTAFASGARPRSG
jgi:hypothetical protein